jgi:quinol monooxygenase YgiN
MSREQTKFKNMVKMYVKHTVANFDKWKVVFEEVEPFRKKMGSSAAHIFRNNSNPNELLVITEWDNKAQGVKFGQSPELKSGMERAGVLGPPEITFSE